MHEEDGGRQLDEGEGSDKRKSGRNQIRGGDRGDKMQLQQKTKHKIKENTHTDPLCYIRFW